IIAVIVAGDPLFGTTLKVPAGALASNTLISFQEFSPADLQSGTGRPLPSTTHMVGGVTMDTAGMALLKPLEMSLPDRIGLDANAQLLVGRLDPSLPAPGNFVFEGFGRVGSIELSIPAA